MIAGFYVTDSNFSFTENRREFVQFIHLLQKMEEDILTSMLNLLKHLSGRQQFFDPISQLFGTMTQRPSRLLLAEAFAVSTTLIKKFF